MYLKLYDLSNYIISSNYWKMFIFGYCSYKVLNYYSNNNLKKNPGIKSNNCKSNTGYISDFENDIWDQFIAID